MIYCAGSRVQFTGQYQRVENLGVRNLAQCWLDSKHRLALSAGIARADATKMRLAEFDRVDDQARL